MSEQDRLRAKLAHELAPALAEQLYQVDKGSRYAKLSDLLTESSRQVYVDAALQVLLGPAQQARIQSVQAAIAEHHAHQEKPAEDVALQARKDVASYGQRCSSVDAGGRRCERAAGHTGNHEVVNPGPTRTH